MGLSSILEQLRRYKPVTSNRRPSGIAGVSRITKKFKDVLVETSRQRALDVDGRMLSLADQAELGLYDTSTISGYRGDEILQSIFRTVEEFEKAKFRDDQRIMFAHMINALLPLIYKHDMEANRKRLLEMLGLDEIRQEIIILADRRRGKTWAVSMTLAAIMICIPGVTIAVFGVAKRASQRMMQITREFIDSHPLGRKMVVVRANQEELFLKFPTDNDLVRTLYSFPGSVHVSLFFIFF